MTDANDTPDTETPVAQWDPETDPDGYTREDIASKDMYLDAVLSFVHGMTDEEPGGTVGLTVISDGVVVSGIAISRAEWIPGLVNQFREAGADKIWPHLEKVLKLGHDSAVNRAKERQEADLPMRSRGFLHMRDVRLGGGEAFTQVPLWRGSLADITGWSLGSWNPKERPRDE